MPRIFHILDTLGIGGAENMVASLARWQAAQGCGVHVHGLMDGGPIAERLQAMQVPVSWHTTRHYAPGLWAVLRRLREFRPDVVHCHNILPTLLGTAAAKLVGIPRLVTTRHGSHAHVERAERRFWFASRWHSSVVAVSQLAYNELGALRFADPSKLVMIPNAADEPDTTPPDVLPRREGFTLVTVGRLVREKSYGTLLEALAMARAEDPEIGLWIVGDGIERGALEQRARELQIQDHVAFLGARSNVGYWLQNADLFVLSSISEGLPVSLLEAFAMRRAVVATRVGGIPDAMEGTDAGLLVASGDARALAQAILTLKRDPARCRECGANARRVYEERYSIARMGRAYQQLYRV